jgi:transposase
MKHYAGIDVSLEESHVAVVDETGKIVSEASVGSEPEALVRYLKRWEGSLIEVGLEAGPLSQWLHAGLTKAGVSVVCLETRQLKAVLKVQRVKSDRNDARGIAQAVRTGWYQPVHVKSLASQQRLALLSARKLVGNKLKDVENGVRGLLRNFGIKLGALSRAKWEAGVRERIEGYATLSAIVEPLIAARQALREQFAVLHRQVLAETRNDPVCRRLMTVPSIGPVVVLGFVAAIDDPTRFRRSRSVGVHFGLTPKRYQSGEVDRVGAISKIGDEMVRTLLYEAATTLLGRVQRFSSLKAWALRLAGRRGLKRARVALARKLAVVLHRIWRDGSEFRWSRTPAV